jgi:type III pantothenate kinase
VSPLRVFADLGNSRLKWGRVNPDGSLDVLALPVGDPSAWSQAWSQWNPTGGPSSWAISTVNPRIAETLGRFLDAQQDVSVRWFRSAADVPVVHELDSPQTAGTDRAFAVLGALAGRSGPGIVVSCGSAITVDRISADGIWQGGAIAPGYRLAAESLHGMSSQLPLVHPDRPPPPWGRSTVPALEAGVFWGTVGLIRTLVARQAEGLSPRPWVIWSGGDVELLRGPTAIDLPDVYYSPSLVLHGVRCVIDGGEGGSQHPPDVCPT